MLIHAIYPQVENMETVYATGVEGTQRKQLQGAPAPACQNMNLDT